MVLMKLSYIKVTINNKIRTVAHIFEADPVK